MRPPCLRNPTLHHSNPRTSEFPLVSLTKEKQFAFDTVEHNREAIALLCDNIFYFAELGMQEFETSKSMMELLEKSRIRAREKLVGHADRFRGELRLRQAGDRAAHGIGPRVNKSSSMICKLK